MTFKKRMEIIAALKSTIELLYENAAKDGARARASEDVGELELAKAYEQCAKQEILMAKYLEVDLRHIEIEQTKEELELEK